jgi:small-conductance mechanosensitive channel
MIVLLEVSMAVWDNIIAIGTSLSTSLPHLASLGVTILIIFIIYKLLISGLKKFLFRKAKTKRDKNNAHMVILFWKYVFLAFGIIAIIFVSTGSLTAFGLSAGLFTAALGWALQRPITGVAGWMMVMVKKPFKIGDRILIEDIKGDVTDITLTHIYIKELGGIIGGEETSGRTILVPNSKLFEKNIINYTFNNKYIRDQVKVQVTYESNLKDATKLAVKAAKTILGTKAIEETEEPYALTYFAGSGINMYVRYQAPNDQLQRIGSSITQKIYETFGTREDIEFAYPHRVIDYKKKKRKN